MDVSSPAAIARLILPKVPLMLKIAICHSLRISHTSSKWDLKTELVIKTLRAMLAPHHPTPISKQQKSSLYDPGIKGNMWISKVTLPVPPQDDLVNLLNQAVEDLKQPSEIYTPAPMAAVEAEWTGYRANVDQHRPRPDLSERQHYSKLMSEVRSDTTLLYFHGGAMFLMDPCTHRATTSRLAHLTNGRVLSVRYRLAPQHPFPAALLDALTAYLSLLHPPSADSFHDAVPAPHIVLAGDSAGGTLCLALIQLLLQVNRSTTKSIRFHNQTITLPIPLPAACSTMAAWLDITRCMPSITKNACYDYLPAPLTREAVSTFPPCEAWPTNPPRGDLYSDTSMLSHPLVSPLAAKDWTGSCPLFFTYGQELLTDEVQAVASRAAKQGVTVVTEQFEAMPHCFAMILVRGQLSKKAFHSWAAFCQDAVRGDQIETRGLWIEAKTGKEKEVDVETLCRMSDEEIRSRMEAAKAARHLGIEGEGKALPKL